MFRNKHFLVPLMQLSVAMALMIFIAGCGGGGGGGGGSSDTTPPSISNVQVNPDHVESVGGDVTISADVTDDSGVKSVDATITKPDHSQITITLRFSTGSAYSRIYIVPKNTGTGVQDYSAVVSAADNANNSASSSTISFQVASESPPPPPF